MKQVKHEILAFTSESTKNAHLFVQFSEEDMDCFPLSEGIRFKVTFTVNGYEWAHYNGGRLRFPVTDKAFVDEEERDSVIKDIGSRVYFGNCVDEPGRKRPPMAKQNDMENEFRVRLESNKDEIMAELSNACEMVKLLLDGSGNPYAKENAAIKAELAAMKEREKRSDLMNIISENVASAVTPMIEEKIRSRVGALAGSVPQELIVKIGDTINNCGPAIRHRKFEKVLSAIVAGESIWLKGDAGTGKSFLCEQIAEALGAKYFCTGTVLDEYAGLKGFVDANGIRHGTQFTHALDAAEQGNEVIMVFDEADGSTPEILLAINNFLAGGVVECMGHAYRKLPNFHVVACGNTNGRGGDTRYTRSIIDEATLDRFVFIEVDYDRSIELNVAGGDEQLATFCRNLRESADRCGVQLLVTYRAIARMLSLMQVWGNRREVMMASVIRGMDASDVGVIYRDLTDHNCPSSEWLEELRLMAVV